MSSQVTGLPLYASFNSGEVTPYLYNRVKYERYAPGAMLLDNFIVTKHGPIFHRPGSLFVGNAQRCEELDFNDDIKRLKKFIFNREQVFMLEFGHKYVKFYSYDSVGDPIVVQKDGKDLIIETPYRAEDLQELRFTQSMDAVYIAHPYYHPRTLTRYSSTNWEFKNFDNKDGPYEPENTDTSRTLQVAATSGNTTLTANFDCFTADMIGRHFRLVHNKKPCWGKIIGYTNARSVPVTLIKNANATTATSSWRLGAWYGTEPSNATPIYGYPINTDKTLDYGVIWDSSEDYTSFGAPSSNGCYLLANENTFSFDKAHRPNFEKGDFIKFIVGDKTALFKVINRVAFYIGQGLPKYRILLDLQNNNIPAGTTLLNEVTFTIDPINTWSKGIVTEYKRDVTTAHYPAAVAFHMERLYFGGGLYTPQTVQGSRPGDFPVFAPTDDEDLVTDDMAVMYTIATDELNSIVWLKSTDSLYIGTIGPEFKLTVTDSEVVTPTNFQFYRIASYGSSRIEPQFIGNSIIFSQNSLRTLRELNYNFSTDKYIANDISVLGEHLMAPGLTSFNYQQEPHSIIWSTQRVLESMTTGKYTRSGGKLIGLTYDKEQNVMAWHRHTIGGKEVEVESVECIFNDSIQQDQVWFCCRRKLGDKYIRTIEVIDKDFRLDTPLEEAYFVDCGAKFNAYKLDPNDAQYGKAVHTLYNLNWLAGEEVNITVDGAIHPNRVVDSEGTLKLDYEGRFITVGLYAPAKYQSLYLNPEAGDSNFAQGHLQNITKAYVRFHRTMGGKIGPAFNLMEDIQYRTPQDKMDNAVPLFTGEKMLYFPANWERSSQVCIVQDEPLPMTLLAIIPEVKVVR